jgi:hypothetical protein
MPMIYTTGVTCTLGADATHNASITNIKAFTYEEVIGEDGEGNTPALVINSTNPIGWNPGHKYVKMTLQCTSDAQAALYTAITGDGNSPHIVPGGDNKPITYFIVTAKMDNGSTRTFTASNDVQPGKATMTIDATGKEVVTIYSFKCSSLTPS